MERHELQMGELHKAGIPRPGCTIAAVLIIVVTLGSCSDPFSPKGRYEERLAIYSVLSTSETAQYARVFTTYSTDGFDPLENTQDTQIAGATITLSTQRLSYWFRDTVLSRPAQDRYSDDIHAYVLDNLTLIPGLRYSINVLVPDGRTISATVALPGHGSVRINNGYVFIAPARYDDDISITASISQLTRGLMIRAFVEYEVLEGSTWTSKRSEIPSGITASPDQGDEGFVYPTLTRRQSVPLPGSGNPGVESAVFAHGAYYALLTRLGQQYGGSMRYRRVAVTLVQADLNLYNYYNIANGFRDQYTMRVDQPDYSNITGGVGVFGAVVTDSAFVDLPPSIVL